MRRPLIGARDFEAFIGQGEQAQGRSWRLTKRECFFCVCMGRRKKKGGGSVRKELVLMCGEVFMGKVCARIKHGRKLCVTSAYNKAFGFFVQLVVPLKSTVGFVSNLN
jgi:hypothetical protein